MHLTDAKFAFLNVRLCVLYSYSPVLRNDRISSLNVSSEAEWKCKKHTSI